MNIRQSLLEMIKAFPGGWDAMCGALGMNRIALQNRIYECKGMDVGVNTALLMQEFSGTTLFAEAVAAQSGGTFVKLPQIDAVGNEEISEKFHEAMETLGKLSIEYRDAVKDGEVNSRERERLNAIIDQMHMTLNQIMALTVKVYCRETAAKGGDE
ncbi:YmfL family putative regulatory protein [Undibacterium sp. Ji22W]|uniref:YmfL family putative regulatory protein n=1 Tax=Undibacterium sp. Ji22W TaxID=3413038 RepID=UPI003BEFC383